MSAPSPGPQRPQDRQWPAHAVSSRGGSAIGKGLRQHFRQGWVRIRSVGTPRHPLHARLHCVPCSLPVMTLRDLRHHLDRKGGTCKREDVALTARSRVAWVPLWAGGDMGLLGRVFDFPRAFRVSIPHC